MHKGYLIGSIILFAMALACIASTVIDVAQEEATLSSLSFWGAVVFHGASAVLALWLLSRAIEPV
jgi:hypothetical protein